MVIVEIISNFRDAYRVLSKKCSQTEVEKVTNQISLQVQAVIKILHKTKILVDGKCNYFHWQHSTQTNKEIKQFSPTITISAVNESQKLVNSKTILLEGKKVSDQLYFCQIH